MQLELTIWAERNLEPVPSKRTLLLMVKRGQLSAVRVGNRWYIDASAEVAPLAPPPAVVLSERARRIINGTTAITG